MISYQSKPESIEPYSERSHFLSLNAAASPEITFDLSNQGTFDAELGPRGIGRATAPAELLDARPRRGRGTHRGAAHRAVPVAVAAVATVSAVTGRGGTKARRQGGREVHRAWCSWKIFQYVPKLDDKGNGNPKPLKTIGPSPFKLHIYLSCCTFFFLGR